MWPVGIPGTLVTSWNAGESGTHCCGLNLTEPASPFLSLNFSRLKPALISADTAADSDSLRFLAMIRRADRQILPHRTNYQTYQACFALQLQLKC